MKNRQPVQIQCMKQAPKAGALGQPRGIGWGGKREGGQDEGGHCG